MAGFDGAVSRLEGSLKNVETAIGRSWDSDGKGGVLTKLTDAAGNLAQSFTEMNTRVVQVGSGLGLLGAGLVGLEGLVGLKNLLGGGTALTASAVALDQSAVALTLAASRLGGGLPGGVPGVPGATAVPRKRPSFLNLLTPATIYEAGSEAERLLFGTLPKPKYPSGYDPEVEYSKGPFARATELYDRMFGPGAAPASSGGAPAPWAAKGIPDFGAGGAAFGPAPAPEVKGSAALNVDVRVEPSDSFISRIISAIRNEINVFGSSPGAGVGTAGSTGLSMPEAGPQP